MPQNFGDSPPSKVARSLAFQAPSYVTTWSLVAPDQGAEPAPEQTLPQTRRHLASAELENGRQLLACSAVLWLFGEQ